MSEAEAEMTIPTIVTERLVIRPHRLADLEACAALWGDPSVVRFIGGTPLTRSQSWMRMLQYKGSWHFLGFGFWAIEERQGGAFVGEAGFLETRRDMAPPIEGTMEVGWVLAPAAHGKGYATEAVEAMIAWGKARFPAQTMTCIIATENGASQRVAAKLGFRELTETTYLGSPITLFQRQGG